MESSGEHIFEELFCVLGELILSRGKDTKKSDEFILTSFFVNFGSTKVNFFLSSERIFTV